MCWTGFGGELAGRSGSLSGNEDQDRLGLDAIFVDLLPKVCGLPGKLGTLSSCAGPLYVRVDVSPDLRRELGIQRIRAAGIVIVKLDLVQR